MTKLFISRGTGPLSGAIMVSAQNKRDAASTMRIKVGVDKAQYLTEPQCVLGMNFTPTINNPRFCLNGIVAAPHGTEFSVDVNYKE
jgi:hypothetical protein